MQINMTLFLQVLNFWITYCFLSKFMFKPVLQVLDKKKQKENLIKKKISEKEELLLSMEKHKKEELDNFKVRMSAEYEIKSPVSEHYISEVSVKKIDKNEVEKLTQMATKLLVERVPRVE